MLVYANSWQRTFPWDAAAPEAVSSGGGDSGENTTGMGIRARICEGVVTLHCCEVAIHLLEGLSVRVRKFTLTRSETSKLITGRASARIAGLV